MDTKDLGNRDDDQEDLGNRDLYRAMIYEEAEDGGTEEHDLVVGVGRDEQDALCGAELFHVTIGLDVGRQKIETHAEDEDGTEENCEVLHFETLAGIEVCVSQTRVQTVIA